VEIQVVQIEILYHPELGDEIDAMMADFINSSRITDIVIKRVSVGYYQFG